MVRARQAFFDSGRIGAMVRAEISASWLRSTERDVSAQPEYGFESDLDLDSRFCRAAAPIIEKLSEQLGGTNTSLFLANERGVLLQRWVDTLSLARALDRANSIEGAVLAESLVGTNAIGTVLAAEQAMTVTGAEHWAENYQTLACAGAPIRNPITKRLEGVLAVTCESELAHPVILSLARQAATSIQETLRITASAGEQQLLDRFVSARRRLDRAVMTASKNMLISSPAALRFAEKIDGSLLWSQISEAQRAQKDVWFTVPDDRKDIEVHIIPSPAVGSNDGVIVEFHERRVARQPASPAGGSPSSGERADSGISDAWRSAVASATFTTRKHSNLVLAGESGSGKSLLAREILLQDGITGWETDSSVELVDGASVWVQRVREVVQAGEPSIVIRHLDRLSDAAGYALAGVFTSESNRPLVVLTCRSMPDLSEAQRALIDALDARVVEVPALRNRQQDIGGLISKLTGGRAATRDALDALRRHEWPGNVRELKMLLESLPARGAPITRQELPVPFQQALEARHFSRLAKAEQATVLEALRDVGGNKARAAKLLGISRSSLYRKLAVIDVDPARRLFD